MKVSLEWITPDAEAKIVRMARVSTSMSEDHPDRLLRYLMTHKHWSPFEMVSACFYIECDRAIGRQILRHRSFSFQEFSQRYAEPAFEPLLPLRVDTEKNRQSSVEIDDVERDLTWQAIQRDAQSLYTQAREIGVAKEVARAVLPEGLTTSRMFMAGTIRSWLHYIELRCGEDTQAEHRAVALAIRTRLSEWLPLVFPTDIAKAPAGSGNDA